MITSRAGAAFALVASRLVHGRESARPGMSGSSAVEPVEAGTAGRARRCTTPAVGGGARVPLPPGEAGGAPQQLEARAFPPSPRPRVTPVAREVVAPFQPRLDVDLARHRLLGAVDVLSGVHRLGRPEQRLRGHA